MEVKRTITRAAVCGAVAGALNGFFGGGGGMLLAPLLTKWLKLEQKRAFATSVMIIVPMCVVSAAMYLMRGSLDFMEALPYICGGVAGGAIAGRFLKKTPGKLLRRLFAAIIIIGGVKNIFWP